MNTRKHRCVPVLVSVSRLVVVGLLAWEATSMVVRGEELEAQVADPELAELGAKVLVKGWKPSWSPDGKQLVFGSKWMAGEGDIEQGLCVLDVETGAVRKLVELGKDAAWSPGEGEHIAYVGGEYGAGEEIWIVKADGGKGRKVAKGGFPSWGPDERTVFYHSRDLGKLMKVRIDVENPRPEEVMEMPWWYPVVSPDGRHVAYRMGNEVAVADTGTAEVVRRLPLDAGRGFLAGWSPCGRYLSYGGYGDHDVIGFWLADLQTGKTSRLSAGNLTMPDWSRDGSLIAIDHRKKGTQEIWVIETKALGHLVEKRAEQPVAVDEEQLREWIRQLEDENFKTREQATKALRDIGPPAVEPLQEALNDPDTEAEVRIRARAILEHIAKKARFGG